MTDGDTGAQVTSNDPPALGYLERNRDRKGNGKIPGQPAACPRVGMRWQGVPSEDKQTWSMCPEAGDAWAACEGAAAKLEAPHPRGQPAV